VIRDDIIRLARKCEDVPLDDSNSNIWVLFTEQLEHFAALVAAAEREACAKVCEEATLKNWFAEDCVALIRERNNL
jgi:hypothetical protein